MHAQVITALRSAILSGTLRPGEALSEAALAQRFGVSCTPVREALKQLERERLVDIVPRVGTYVRKATGDEVLDGLVVKEALEGMAARLAAQRGDVASLRISRRPRGRWRRPPMTATWTPAWRPISAFTRESSAAPAVPFSSGTLSSW